MTDTVSREARSKIMAKVQSKGTKLEKVLLGALIERRWDFLEEQPQDILGHPDFIYRECKVAIFVDSCFWHGCPRHVRMPSSNVDYWTKKIARNKKRDARVRAQLRQEGWHVVAIWEHELPDTRSLKGKLTRIGKFIAEKTSMASASNAVSAFGRRG